MVVLRPFHKTQVFAGYFQKFPRYLENGGISRYLENIRNFKIIRCFCAQLNVCLVIFLNITQFYARNHPAKSAFLKYPGNIAKCLNVLPLLLSPQERFENLTARLANDRAEFVSSCRTRSQPNQKKLKLKLFKRGSKCVCLQIYMQTEGVNVRLESQSYCRVS